MKDRIVEFPHRYKLVPAGGDFVDLLPAPGFVTQEGTPLNRETLLSGGTAAALGLTQDDPTVDGALMALCAAQAGGVRLAWGSYVGTGTYGADHPNSLSFDFEPYVVLVFKERYGPAMTFADTAFGGGSTEVTFSYEMICFLRGSSSVRVPGLTPKDLNGNLGQTAIYMPYEMEGNSLSWKYTNTYGTGNIGPQAQLNVSNAAYRYIAAGRGNGV